MRLRLATLYCHCTVIVLLVASVLETRTAARAALAVAIVTPLLLTIRGLARARNTTLQRLAVLLVAYIGGASVEVVARGGSAPLVNAVLLAAALELGLLLALIRRRVPPGATVRE